MPVGMLLREEVGKKCSQALIPSLCGISVYNETSNVTSTGLAGELTMVRSLLRKSSSSSPNDGSLWTNDMQLIPIEKIFSIHKAREPFLIQKGRTIDPDGLNIREKTAIFRMEDIRKNLLSKFIEISIF